MSVLVQKHRSARPCLYSKILRGSPLTRKKNPNVSPWLQNPPPLVQNCFSKYYLPLNTILIHWPHSPTSSYSPFIEHTWIAPTSSTFPQGPTTEKLRYPSGPVRVKFSQDILKKKTRSSPLNSPKAWFYSLVSIPGCLLYLFLYLSPSIECNYEDMDRNCIWFIFPHLLKC